MKIQTATLSPSMLLGALLILTFAFVLGEEMESSIRNPRSVRNTLDSFLRLDSNPQERTLAEDSCRISILALGDSYISGTGAKDSSGRSNYENEKCFRSAWGWAPRYAASLGASTFRNFGCHGYKINDMTGDYTWIATINDPTKLILVSAGGNDLGFASVVEQCFVHIYNDYEECKKNVEKALGGIRATKSKIKYLLRTIVNRGFRNAKIVLVGYPLLVTQSSFTLCEVWSNFRVRPQKRKCFMAAAAVRDGGRVFDAVQAQAVNEFNAEVGKDVATFISVQENFAGHEVDPTRGDNPFSWLVEYEGNVKDDEGRWFLNSMRMGEYFHQNPKGHSAMVDILKDKLFPIVTLLTQPPFCTTNGRRGGPLDLALVIDSSQSMEETIKDIIDRVSSLVDELGKQFSDSRVAVVDYRDFPNRTNYDKDYPARLALDFTNDRSRLQSTFESLNVGYGGDGRETMYSGLIAALSLDWRPGATKAILHYGDSQPLDPEPFTGFTRSSVIDKSLVLINRFLVHDKSLAEEMDHVAIFFAEDVEGSNVRRNIANATGGVVLNDDSNTIIHHLLEVDSTVISSPFAWVGVSYTGYTNLPMTFDGSGSHGINGALLISYEWDINGDGTYDAFTKDPYFQWSYSEGYFGLLELRVTDSEGRTALATASVLVSVDGDSVPDDVDNCPEVQNELQIDTDGDGIGDECDPSAVIRPFIRIDSMRANETSGTLLVSALLSDPTGDAKTLWSIYECFEQDDPMDLLCNIRRDCVVEAEAELKSSISCLTSGRRFVVIDAISSTGHSSDSMLIDIIGNNMMNNSGSGKSMGKGGSGKSTSKGESGKSTSKGKRSMNKGGSGKSTSKG